MKSLLISCTKKPNKYWRLLIVLKSLFFPKLDGSAIKKGCRRNDISRYVDQIVKGDNVIERERMQMQPFLAKQGVVTQPITFQ